MKTEIETKYNIGEKVYFTYQNVLYCYKIKFFDIHISSKNEKLVRYLFDILNKNDNILETILKDENQIYKTKEELLKNICIEYEDIEDYLNDLIHK